MMRAAHCLSLGVSSIALLQIAIAEEAPPVTHVTTLPQGDYFSNSTDGASVSLSANGRYAAFVSYARLVREDTNVLPDVYVFDTMTGDVTLETLTREGRASNGGSLSPRLDGNGRYLVFTSLATNLVDRRLTPGSAQVFLRDRVERTTRLLSVDRQGAPPSHTQSWSGDPVTSLDGNTVAFASTNTTLVAAEDRNGRGLDVYLVRLADGGIQRVSVTSAGGQPATGASFTPSLSADGRVVGFTSTADLACPPGGACAHGGPMDNDRGNDRANVYTHDMRTRRTARVSRARDGDEPNGPSFHPTLSANGRFMAFASRASNLVAKDRNDTADVFVANLESGSIELVSRTPRGHPANGKSERPALSGDGSLVAFASEASNLVCASRCAPRERDINMVSDVFLHDRRRGTTQRVSADSAPEWMDPSVCPTLAPFAPLLAFSSRHPPDSGDGAGDVSAYLTRLSEAPHN